MEKYRAILELENMMLFFKDHVGTNKVLLRITEHDVEALELAIKALKHSKNFEDDGR